MWALAISNFNKFSNVNFQTLSLVRKFEIQSDITNVCKYYFIYKSQNCYNETYIKPTIMALFPNLRTLYVHNWSQPNISTTYVLYILCDHMLLNGQT